MVLTNTFAIRMHTGLSRAASCTTNCLAPIVKVIHEELGIRHGSITTIHDVTNTQTIFDRPNKDPRRARSALYAGLGLQIIGLTALTQLSPSWSVTASLAFVMALQGLSDVAKDLAKM